jgi:hypothetical protein
MTPRQGMDEGAGGARHYVLTTRLTFHPTWQDRWDGMYQILFLRNLFNGSGPHTICVLIAIHRLGDGIGYTQAADIIRY